MVCSMAVLDRIVAIGLGNSGIRQKTVQEDLEVQGTLSLSDFWCPLLLLFDCRHVYCPNPDAAC
jgi:hypothetical protein